MARPEGFAARFGSICPRCNGEIAPRDRVVWANSRQQEVIHTRCASGQDDE